MSGLTQFLTYQQYVILRRAEREVSLQEAARIGDKLKTSLGNSLSATRTLAFVVEKYGAPDDFDAIAKNILGTNPFIDAVELTRKGVITHIYPIEGHETAIGYDVLSDPSRNEEALKALHDKKLYFAGPLELRQGGMAVVGRLPIFRDSAFWGFSVVIIRLRTLLKAAGIDSNDDGEFLYQLSKRNPTTLKEEYFIESFVPSSGEDLSIQVPDGQWNLYVMRKNPPNVWRHVLSIGVVGLLLSVAAGAISWRFVLRRQHLKMRIIEAGREMEAYQQSATTSLRRVNRLYHFTSRVNHMVVHVTSEAHMYHQACEIAVDIGKYRMAWIGLIDEGTQKINSVASAGDEQGYLSEIVPISLKPTDLEGPAMRMIRTGTFVYCNNIATDPLMKPWSGKALKRGFRASIILPIRKAGKIIGSFNLYSGEPDSFDEKEIQLLLETADNISFVLENFEKDRLRTKVELQMQSEKILSDSIINSLPGIFYFYDANGRFLRWNKNFELVSGFTSDEIEKMHPLDFFRGEERKRLEKKIANVFHSGYDDVISGFHTKDGRTVPYYFNGKKIIFDGFEYLIGMGLDISDRIKVENELRERTQEIEKLSAHLQSIREEERARMALEIHDVLGQQLTALKMDATWVKKRTANDDALGARLTTMISLVDDTIRTVRRISSELRPSILDDLGLLPALEWQGAEFEKNTGTRLHFEHQGTDIQLERNFSTNVFRIYQEALTNVTRHANATEVHTRVMVDGSTLQMVVKDNGVGFDPTEIRNGQSLGLISMKERARIFGGELTVAKNSPNGTVISLTMPLTKKTTLV